MPGLTHAQRSVLSAAGSKAIDGASRWLEPWAASGYEQRGLVLEAEGRLTEAASDLRRAISHEPTNFVHWLLLARIQTERGLYDVALRDYRQARRLGRQAQVFLLSPSYGVF